MVMLGAGCSIGWSALEMPESDGMDDRRVGCVALRGWLLALVRKGKSLALV